MIDRMLALAERFNRQITGIPIPETPTALAPDRAKAKHEAFIEEDNEFLELSTVQDQADALIDGIYFRLGALLEMGVLPGPVFDAVHEANMRKERGTVAKRQHSQGFDAVKPPGWTPPDLTPFMAITRDHYDVLMKVKDDPMFEERFMRRRAESERDEARQAVSRAHTFLRNVATDLEEGDRDPLAVADDIHEAMGDGRPNNTKEDGDEDAEA